MPNVMGIIANTPYIAFSIVLSLPHKAVRAVDPEADEVHSPLLSGPYVNYRRAADHLGSSRLYPLLAGTPLGEVALQITAEWGAYGRVQAGFRT